MKLEKLLTAICFIGLASPLWFGLLVALSLNAYAPGFEHEPVQPDTTEFYRTLPQRIKHKHDSLLKNKQDKVNRNQNFGL